MQKKKTTKPIKQIIIFIAIIIILLLLLIFAEDIIKLTNKNKINLVQNSENELISNEPNPPQLSAGMIPVKWNGTNWVITTSDDKDWYNYSKGKPAYIMLNDGKYQSELIRDMTNKELAEKNVGNDAINVPNISNNNPTMLMWIPRFVYKESGEIGHIKEETTLGEGWILPDLFTYKITDNTKPDFSLSGVWVEKDVDADYANKITKMNSEQSIYGFIANTKPKQITSTDINELQRYIGNDVPVVPSIIDLTNQNRIILQIINDKKHEPIKADIIQNKEEQRLEIRVTYTSNGISKIINDYGEEMTLTKTDGIIYTDTSNITLAKGTYSFTVIDNKGNKKELSITPSIDSLLKVAYINGTDNMDNTATYNKSNETVSSTETALLDQIKEQNTEKIYSRAIKDYNGLTTAVSYANRSEDDEDLDIVKLYNIKYPCSVSETYYKDIDAVSWYTGGYTNYSINSSSSVTFSGKRNGSYTQRGAVYYYHKDTLQSNVSGNVDTYNVSNNTFYKFICVNHNNHYKTAYYSVYKMTIKQTSNTPQKGTFNQTSVVRSDAYTNNAATGSYWYEKVEAAPKYTLYKYDSNLELKSTYDVDTKTLTTKLIDISNKGNNKLKLTLNTSGTNYKTYISNDNTNWQEVTGITSNTPKELNVDGWDNLFIKIETNTSRINNIDVAFYKD